MQEKITAPTSPYYYGSYLFKVISTSWTFCSQKLKGVCSYIDLCRYTHIYIHIYINKRENIEQV